MTTTVAIVAVLSMIPARDCGGVLNWFGITSIPSFYADGTMQSRRSFLQAAAIGTGLAFTRSHAFADRTETPWLRRTLKIGMIGGKGSLEEKFTIALEAGFEGVEMNVPGTDVESANAAAEKTGLIIDGTVGGYHWEVRHTDPDDAVRADALTKLKAGIRETRAMGADTMLLVPGHGKDGTAEEVYSRAVAAVEAALPVAEENKVAILIENVWNHFLYDHDGGSDQTAEDLAKFIDHFDSPLVGVQFDIGNHWKYGDPAAWIRTLGSRIQKLDIKGFSRGSGQFTKIGEGDIDWASVETALHDIQFQGWLAAEVQGGDLQRLKEVVNNMNAALHCDEVIASAR
ncbi:fructoselysine 3-epimerase [Rubripirellula amarantea]|uniref:Fructoselysine 3-epimerase n=1 Tax=Rubripirellula amarantea TaxID=2527999 RepID=A0A5C5WJ00_9BACT|nr:sugar phosphate isomerase/epimerase family protein [Rubripirellula amarantea]TWT50600.1 fructoselysine 3-epimerase [Rubripirellula amarantea]